MRLFTSSVSTCAMTLSRGIRRSRGHLSPLPMTRSPALRRFRQARLEALGGYVVISPNQEEAEIDLQRNRTRSRGGANSGAGATSRAGSGAGPSSHGGNGVGGNSGVRIRAEAHEYRSSNSTTLERSRRYKITKTYPWWISRRRSYRRSYSTTLQCAGSCSHQQRRK